MLPLFSGMKNRKDEITANLWILDSKDKGCG